MRLAKPPSAVLGVLVPFAWDDRNRRLYAREDVEALAIERLVRQRTHVCDHANPLLAEKLDQDINQLAGERDERG